MVTSITSLTPSLPGVDQPEMTPDSNEPGTNVEPGVDPDSIAEDQELTEDMIEQLWQQTQSTLAGQLGGIDIRRMGLNFNLETGLRQIKDQKKRGLEAAVNNAVQRGLFNSGIRIENQRDVTKAAADAEGDLRRGVTLGLMELQNQVLQLQNQAGLDFAGAVSELTQGDVQWANEMMETFGLDPDAVAKIGSQGQVVNRGGKTVFTRNVGEAPNNIGNRDHPTYQARAEFMTGQLQNVLSQFNVRSQGQWRSASTPGGGNRSHNSDHYSGGAIDLAGSPDELMRVFQWAQQQPWVSFAQIYPGGNSMHISANINAFGDANLVRKWAGGPEDEPEGGPSVPLPFYGEPGSGGGPSVNLGAGGGGPTPE